MSMEQTLQSLGNQKEAFIEDCRSKVYDYIIQQDRRYIVRIIEKDAYGPGQHRTHCPGIDSYLAVLACFCFGDPYEGHQLDSVLTEPVVDIVCTSYCRLIERNSDQIQAFLKQKIEENDIVLQETLKIVLGDLSRKGLKMGQSQIIHLVHETISQVAQTAAHSQIGITIGHSIAAIAGTTAGQMMAKILMKAIAHHVAMAVSHTAGNAIVMAAVKTAAKKVVIASVGAIIVKLMATKLGITSAASVVHVAGWLFIGGYLIRKIYKLKEEMATKVSEGVEKTLNNKYEDCVTEILGKLADSVQDPAKLASTVISEITDSDIKGLQRTIEGDCVDLSNPDFRDLEKGVKKGVGNVWGWGKK